MVGLNDELNNQFDLPEAILNMKFSEPINDKLQIGESNANFLARNKIYTIGDLLQLDGQELVDIFKSQNIVEWYVCMHSRLRIFVDVTLKELNLSYKDVRWYKEYMYALELCQEKYRDTIS